jgi:hypothetical protein
VYKISDVFVVSGQSELMKFDENWTLDTFWEFSNGCFIPLRKFSLINYSRRTDIVDYISGLIGTEEWELVLVDWSW